MGAYRAPKRSGAWASRKAAIKAPLLHTYMPPSRSDPGSMTVKTRQSIQIVATPCIRSPCPRHRCLRVHFMIYLEVRSLIYNAGWQLFRLPYDPQRNCCKPSRPQVDPHQLGSAETLTVLCARLYMPFALPSSWGLCKPRLQAAAADFGSRLPPFLHR